MNCSVKCFTNNALICANTKPKNQPIIAVREIDTYIKGDMLYSCWISYIIQKIASALYITISDNTF